MNIAGKVAVVTGGAGGGSGGAISARLATEGANVVVVDVDQDAGAQQVHAITEAGGSATFFAADVRHPATVNVLMDFVDAQFGGLDVVVNNATDDPGGRGPLDEWAKSIDIDLLGPALLLRASVERMRKRGGGAVVNVGSTSALPHGDGHSTWPAYDAAKAGIIRLTTSLDWLRQDGIRVNCLVPGWIASPPVRSYVDSLSDDQRRERGVPDRLLTPDEVASAVLRLLVDDSLAGRVLLLRNDQPPALIAAGDPGYAALELLPEHYV